MATKTKHYSTRDYVRFLLTLGYKFRMNQMNDSIEVNGESLTDGLRARIKADCYDGGFGYGQQVTIENAWHATAYDNSYHPIKEYLESLTYDNGLHIENLAKHFKDTDGYFARWFELWLIGCIAKIYDQTQNYMFVLDGAQGIGKSTFANWLGNALPKYFVESPINTSQEFKDVKLLMISKWIWEVSELGASFRKSDREALKFLISQKTVTVRPPYGRNFIEKPAAASLIGTINNEAGFLTDPTGNRRYLVCELTHIDHAYSQKIDVHQVFAQAYHLYKAGRTNKLNSIDNKEQSAINKRYRAPSYLIDLFLKHYDYQLYKPVMTEVETKKYNEVTPSVDIINELKIHHKLGNSDQQHYIALAAGLKELGIDGSNNYTIKNGSGKTERKKGYRGVFLRSKYPNS